MVGRIGPVAVAGKFAAAGQKLVVQRVERKSIDAAADPVAVLGRDRVVNTTRSMAREDHLHRDGPADNRRTAAGVGFVVVVVGVVAV